MAIDGKPNAKGRTSGKPRSKAYRYINPPTDEPWLHLTHELLRSPALMALSQNAFKILFRLLDEHVAHGRSENGELRVSQQQLSEHCGIRYQSVPKAVRELEAIGLVAVVRSGKMLGKDAPNLYRLTMYGDGSLTAPPTNEWKRFRSIEHAKERVKAVEDRYQKERRKQPLSTKQRKKAINTSANVTEISAANATPLRGDI